MNGRAKLCLCAALLLFLAAGCETDNQGEWPFDADEAKQRQAASAGTLDVPVEKSLDLGGGVKMKLVLIPAGEFMMGSEDGFDDEVPVRQVTLTQPFYMSAYEVTQEQYERVMGENPSQFEGARNPVERVSWENASEFCRRISARTGLDVCLPTEAQWEYACRAGTNTAFYTGEAISTDEANFNGKYVEGHNEGQVYRATTMPVGSFEPNAFGLYDMHGNVCEWCADRYQESYEGLATRDPEGPKTGELRVFRGGSWYDGPFHCRSADRPRTHPGNGGTGLSGFRIVVRQVAAGGSSDTAHGR